jgi:hypothetical protein
MNYSKKNIEIKQIRGFLIYNFKIYIVSLNKLILI